MMPTPQQTPILYDQHGAFFGTTGSGKTYEGLLLLNDRMNRLIRARVPSTNYKVIHIDTKRAGPGYDEETGYFVKELRQYRGQLVRDWRAFNFKRANDPIYHVYRPYRELQTPDDFDLFFDFLLNQEIRFDRKTIQLPMLVVIDEYTDIFGGDTQRTQYMPNFTKILAQGRATRQTIWLASQKTSFIDADIKANITVKFCFRLPNEDDRKRVAGLMGGDKRVTKPIRDVHGFWYQNDMFEWAIIPLYYNGKKGA